MAGQGTAWHDICHSAKDQHASDPLVWFLVRAHRHTCWALVVGCPGFQVLLQMNIAYYLPSIPVLLLFGQVEKLLDAKFGPTTSMAMRLMAGECAARGCGRHRGAP